MKRKNVGFKAVLFGIVILFLIIGVLQSSAGAVSAIWVNAQVDLDVTGLSSDAVEWLFGSPAFNNNKRNVFFYYFYSTKGSGSLKITPFGQPTIYYDFPEDFNYFFAVHLHSFLGLIYFRPDEYNSGYETAIYGRGLLVMIE